MTTPRITVIAALRTYLKTYTGLKSGAPVWVNHLGKKPTEYAVMPLPGQRIIQTYLDDSTLREFPFAFQSMESTADELQRLATIGFYELFADWLEAQTEAGTFPTLNADQEVEKIEALGQAFLMEQGESSSGVYQIQAKLTYSQKA